jgi:membrane fusion protein, multidrug efflux system
VDNTGDVPSNPVGQARPAASPAVPSEGQDGSHPANTSGFATIVAAPPVPASPPTEPPHHLRKRLIVVSLSGFVLAVAAYFLVPWVILALNTVSTDDAYVNSHVTFVAPRVADQVIDVLVDDNYRVKKGDLLVRLDKEPYQVQVDILTAAVGVAQTNLEAGSPGPRQSLQAGARHRRG